MQHWKRLQNFYSMDSKTKILLVFGLIILLLIIFNKKVMGLGSMVKNFAIRNDSSGLGTFGQPREGHIHQGLDIQAQPNETIKAPFDLEYSFTGNVYKDDPNFKATEYKTKNGTFRVMYMQPIVSKKFFKQGEPIGIAQNIASKWGKGMINHIHVEIREKGILKDPKNFI